MSAAPRVEVDAEVLRRIRQHARSSMQAEVCGVLIGGVRGKVTMVEACIEGEEAAQGGSHVTFTQNTWTHIYKIKDAEFPEERIVGWYHSHPGFGVFLSEHDTFIQKHFFSDPTQIAWVYDPHSDEEGCFAWDGKEIVRLKEISWRDEGKDVVKSDHEVSSPRVSAKAAAEAAEDKPAASGKRRWPRAVRWIGFGLTHLAVLLLGFLVGVLLFPVVEVVHDGGNPGQSQGMPERK
jgi:proteasome lid subunit RPN8/RPN11